MRYLFIKRYFRFGQPCCLGSVRLGLLTVRDQTMARRDVLLANSRMTVEPTLARTYSRGGTLSIVGVE